MARIVSAKTMLCCVAMLRQTRVSKGQQRVVGSGMQGIGQEDGQSFRRLAVSMRHCIQYRVARVGEQKNLQEPGLPHTDMDMDIHEIQYKTCALTHPGAATATGTGNGTPNGNGNGASLKWSLSLPLPPRFDLYSTDSKPPTSDFPTSVPVFLPLVFLRPVRVILYCTSTVPPHAASSSCQDRDGT